MSLPESRSGQDSEEGNSGGYHGSVEREHGSTCDEDSMCRKAKREKGAGALTGRVRSPKAAKVENKGHPRCPGE